MDLPAMETRETRRSALPSQPDLDAAFERCGASHEALRECVIACRRSARRGLDAELYRLLSARGHDARALCARELCARLADLSVGELLQMIAMGRKDVSIEVLHGALVSRIWCSAGEIVDAVSGRLQGEPAAYRILALDAGELVADFRPVRRPRVIATSTQEVMLEAMRRKDECAVLQRRLGGSQRVYSSVPSAMPSSAVNNLESAALQAFTPGAAIDTVLAGSAQADLETLQAVSALVERGHLVPSDAGAVCRLPAASAPAVPLRRQPWAWFREMARPRLWLLLGASAALGVVAAVLWPIRPAARLAEQSTGRLSAAPSAAGLTAAAPTAAALPAPSPSVPERAAPTSPGVFAVEVVVEPAQATFWLDGVLVAAGDFSILLTRDGRLHELRITAPGHLGQTLLFRDVSPPRAVVLEREGPDVR
jgi:hypothetical protein